MTDEKTALERRQELIDAQPQRAGYYRTDYAEAITMERKRRSSAG